MLFNKKLSVCVIGALLFSGFAQTAAAVGMLPATTIVKVNEADGEGVMSVTNTDSTPDLLYTTIDNSEDKKGPPILITPPVARVEPGKTQLVRFILENKTPLQVEHFEVVTFHTIPPNDPTKKNEVKFSVSQMMPLIIHPAKLADDQEPWKLVIAFKAFCRSFA